MTLNIEEEQPVNRKAFGRWSLKRRSVISVNICLMSDGWWFVVGGELCQLVGSRLVVNCVRGGWRLVVRWFEVVGGWRFVDGD